MTFHNKPGLLNNNITRTHQLVTLTIPDYLFEEQWDFVLIRALDAWEKLQNDPQRAAKGNTAFGNPEVIIAVCNDGTDITHPDLNSPLSNGAAKILQVYDVEQMAANMNRPASSKGTACSSVATAFTNTTQGMAGIAGNSRLMAIQRDPSFKKDAAMFAWIAGIDPGNAAFPPLPPGAAIISNSWSRPAQELENNIAAVINNITNYGRQGKGTLLFIEAGDDHFFYETLSSYASHPRVMAISASTVDNTGKEIFAPYSNWGAGIQCCAPSVERITQNPAPLFGPIVATHRPDAPHPVARTTVVEAPAPSPVFLPNSIEVADVTRFVVSDQVIIGDITSAGAERFEIIIRDPDRNVLVLDRPWMRVPLPGNPVTVVFGNCPGTAVTNTTLAADAVSGRSIQVTNTALFNAARAVMINPGTPESESHAIQRVDSVTGTVHLMTDLLQPANCRAGNRVDVGPADYKNNFTGGTSYSTPVCAGIAALCLAANKNLSWVEVRHIIRDTARKINPGETGIAIQMTDAITVHFGKWRDAEGKDILSNTGTLTPGPNQPFAIITGINVDRDMLELNSAAGFITGQAISITNNTHAETRLVLQVAGNTLVLDEPLSLLFNLGNDVAGGLLPQYSAFYGYGRVDAGKAVQAALDSVTNYRQLVIRNNLSDTGTAPTTAIQSPDIWLTNEITNAIPIVPSAITVKRSAVGLDDLTHNSKFESPFPNTAILHIVIDSNGPDGDTIRYTIDGTEETKAAITGVDQELAWGFAIKFKSIWGHKIGDSWTVYIDRVDSLIDYTKDGPHESPKKSFDRSVHTRIKNIVTGSLATQFTNLDCWARFFIVLSDGKTANGLAQGTGFDSNFHFSSTGKNNDWDDTRPISAIINGDAGTYFLGEVAIPEGAIAPSDPSNKEKGTHIVTIRWKTDDRPPSDLAYSVFLLVHLSPFHGPLNGTGAHNNSCLSYREIAFVDFDFRENLAVPLDTQLLVDTFGTAVNQPFRVDVAAELGTFLTEKLQLELIRINDNGTQETAIFHHDGTAWIFRPANPAWTGLQVNAPVIFETDTLAEGEQTHLSFRGVFLAAKEHQQIIIRAQLLSKHSTAIIAAREVAVNIIQRDEVPIGINEKDLFSPPPPDSHAFADMELLVQNADQRFGPVNGQENDAFRVTSLFTASGTTNAYAITDGILFLQPGSDPQTVNLVLKPIKQPVIGFTPVKYFIYRGLRIADFLDPSDETKVLAEHDSNSAFIKRQRTIFKAQNEPGTDFLSKALGYDREHQPDNSILDSYFFKTEPGLQLPFVAGGTALGRFLESNNSTFGLDILLEEGSFATTLAYVRRKAHIITVNGMSTATDAARMLKKLRQEEILNFLDPAAFYGMHTVPFGRVKTKNASGEIVVNKGAEIYNKVVDKFHTKNRLYLDIRNENGNSYNFYSNYKGNTGTPDVTKNIQLGIVDTQLIPQVYQTHGWPVIIEDRPAQNSTGDANQLYCSLRFNDNKTPILYVEAGNISGSTNPSSPRFIDAAVLGDATTPWTAPVRFSILNTGPSGAKLNMATIIKLFYGRTQTATTTWPDTVLRTESPTDNVFGPLDLSLLWKSDSRIKWITAQDKKFVDFIEHGYMAERGVALDGFLQGNTNAGRAVFFAVANDYYAGPPGVQIHGITGGVSTRNTFFEAAKFLGDQKLFFDQLFLDGALVNTLQLVPAGIHALSPDAVLLLCVSRGELESLKAIPGFHTGYPRYARLELVLQGKDSTNKSYSKYQLKVQGLDTNGKYKLAAPGRAIFVYSVDSFLYFSDAYSKDEPIPTTYRRTAEENTGILVNPATKDTWEDFFIKKDSMGKLGDILDRTESWVNEFVNQVKNTPNNDTARDSLEVLIKTQLKHILRRIRAFVTHNNNSNADDRILYWARIKMKVALQSHTLLLQSGQARRELLDIFESSSRGYDEADFTNAVTENCKKVLLIGFDPSFLRPTEGSAHNVHNSNPSSAAALALHGQFIVDSGKKVAFIQSVILPVRYTDLDKNGGEGIVEEVLNQFIDPTDQPVPDPGNPPKPVNVVDAIIVMDKYLPDSVMFSRFAARRRGPQKDNNFQFGGNLPPGIAGDEFYESTLPIASSLTPVKFDRFFNQTYAYSIKASQAIKKFTDPKRKNADSIPDDPDGNDPANLLPVNQPAADIKAINGAVDPYFGNEVFYRLAVLAEKKNKAVKIGLLSLPRLQGTAAEAAGNKKIKKDFDPVLTKEVIDEVRDIIRTMTAFDL